MMKKTVFIITTLMFISGLYSTARGHCEIPCGIYGDKMRFDMWLEQITTVEKSMNQIVALSKESPVNYNQIVRWVTNKDVHADDIREIAVQYFLAQRVQPTAADAEEYKTYTAQLETLHHIIVHAMKAKQTTDLEHVEELRKLVKKFYELYFDEEMKAHLEEHEH